MKKKITDRAGRKGRAAVMTVLLILIGGMAGCDAGRGGAPDDHAYVDETQSAGDDAVNTLKAGSKYRIVTPMMELKEAVVEILSEDYWPDTMLTGEELAERVGISDNMYDSFLAEYQRAEAGIDMMIIIDAREDSVADVEKYLNEYRELLLRIYEKQPQNRAKVFASRIETIQDHICYIQLGADITSLEKEGEDKMVAYCQQENERALDAIEKKILSRITE